MHGIFDWIACPQLEKIAAMAIIAGVGLSSESVRATGFEGTWRSAVSARAGKSIDSATILHFRQFGSVVCGEWSESIENGKILGGNITGRATNRQINAHVGEDIYWAHAGAFPHQKSESALFMLQGRKLIWYVRNQLSRLDKIQTFERVDDTGNSLAQIEFMDRQFARLCPAGTDFTSARHWPTQPNF
ncbi:MAG: hypothetical protein U1F34_07775 [Gammaproteobacteria bacterium]